MAVIVAWPDTKMVARFLLLAFLASAVFAEKARFDNYRVYRVLPENHGQLEILKFMQDQANGLDFWSPPGKVNATVDIMVPPHLLPDFMDGLKDANIRTELYIENVQELVDNEQPVTRSTRLDWTGYHRLNVIYEWLDSIVTDNPNIVSAINGGSSYEGRQIRGVKVSYKSGNPGVFIEGGIHAREWISPATVTYILNQLLTSTVPAVRDIAENYDWYIFPSTNPDGYEFTHTTNRMWRKTRSRDHVLCYGTDPNRNWNFHWMDGGASSNPCSETYAGSSAFSEIETKTLSDYITSVSDSIDIYLSFHSFSQLLLIPYGHTNEPISNYDRLKTIGDKAMEALATRYGTQYTVGNIVDVLYVASGSSVDWVRGTFHTPITYIYELRDTGRFGFVLPANQIIPTGEETLDSVVSILQDARVVINAPK